MWRAMYAESSSKVLLHSLYSLTRMQCSFIRVCYKRASFKSVEAMKELATKDPEHKELVPKKRLVP